MTLVADSRDIEMPLQSDNTCRKGKSVTYIYFASIIIFSMIMTDN